MCWPSNRIRMSCFALLAVFPLVGGANEVQAGAGVSAGPRVGDPVPLYLELPADPPLAGRLPDGPWRDGEVTGRTLGVRTIRPGIDRLDLEVQFFTPGHQRLTGLPLRVPADGWLPLPEPVEVEIHSILDGVEPEHRVFRPSRPGRPPTPGGSSLWRWVGLGGGVAAGLAVIGWLLRRRRVAPADGSPRAVPQGLSVFLLRLEELEARRAAGGDPKDITARVMALLREFLAWRFTADMRPLTVVEIGGVLARRGEVPEMEFRHLLEALQRGDAARFAPTPVPGPPLSRTARDFMLEIGPPPPRSLDDVGSADA